jgi:2-oxo-3-hexenedioate decarboxylase/2-keto-4-pentenoate hydratase
VQKQLGVDQPDYGMLFDDMAIPDGWDVPADRLIQPKVEAEIAFVLGRDLDEARLTVADVIRAVEFALPAIEIVDSRIADWKLTLRDTVADNASSGAVVLGPWVPLDGLDLPTARASLQLNGTEIDSGLGSAVLGDPAAAVAWLANAFAPFGTDLLPGQFIMSGSFTTAALVHPGDSASATISGLGTVSLTFT